MLKENIHLHSERSLEGKEPPSFDPLNKYPIEFNDIYFKKAMLIYNVYLQNPNIKLVTSVLNNDAVDCCLFK